MKRHAAFIFGKAVICDLLLPCDYYAGEGEFCRHASDYGECTCHEVWGAVGAYEGWYADWKKQKEACDG